MQKHNRKRTDLHRSFSFAHRSQFIALIKIPYVGAGALDGPKKSLHCNGASPYNLNLKHLDRSELECLTGNAGMAI